MSLSSLKNHLLKLVPGRSNTSSKAAQAVNNKPASNTQSEADPGTVNAKFPPKYLDPNSMF